MGIEEKFIDFFRSKGLNDYGVFGLMGNIYAESGLSSKNLQNTYNKKFGLSDEDYTAQVDNGIYQNFVNDRAGYGLAQWTYWSRKQKLLAFAKSRGVSIGDEDMQLDFLYKELSESFPRVLESLRNAKSIFDASSAILLNFEKPANQGTETQNKRASYGQDFYNKYAGRETTMATNSPLVTYTNLTPYNRTKPRKGKILYIIPHCYVGQVTAKRGCDGFYPNGRGASSHYVIGYDGQIGQSVDEANRAWTTGGDLSVNGYTGATMDHYAVTIEVASDTYNPYAITDAAYNSLVRLMADIAKRNGIKKLLWKADKSLVGQPDKQNVLVHRWFASKSCPGDYMYSRMGDIVAKANQILGASGEPVEKAVNYQVKVTASDGLNCRTEPVYGNVVTTYPENTVLHITKESDGWGYTGQGWVSLSYTTKINDTEDEDMDVKSFEKLWLEYRRTLQDNDSGKWSQEARDWAVNSGLIAGGDPFPDGSPNYMWADLMTREQLCQVLYRFAQMMGKA